MSGFTKYIFILFMTNLIFSQNKEEVYIILDDHSLYRMIKKEGVASLEIPYYLHKESWKMGKSKKNTKSNDDIVKVDVTPNKKYYTFYSIRKPIKRSSLDGIKVFSVENVSKEDKRVWKQYPYTMVFIEKTDCEDYMLWYMKPEFNE